MALSIVHGLFNPVSVHETAIASAIERRDSSVPILTSRLFEIPPYSWVIARFEYRIPDAVPARTTALATGILLDAAATDEHRRFLGAGQVWAYLNLDD